MTDEKPRVIIIPPKPELQQTTTVTKQLRVEFCRAFERREQPPQALGFVFLVANGIILFLCQLADQASGSVLVERLRVQNVIQFSLRIRMCRYGRFLWLNDAFRLLCQLAEQMCDLLFDLRRRQFGADALEVFLRGCSLWQSLLGLALFGGCFK